MAREGKGRGKGQRGSEAIEQRRGEGGTRDEVRGWNGGKEWEGRRKQSRVFFTFLLSATLDSPGVV